MSAVRVFWVAVLGLSLAVPAALVIYGHEYNQHTSSTVGGPLTQGLSIVLAVAFEVLFWAVVLLLIVAARTWKSRRSGSDVRS